MTLFPAKLASCLLLTLSLGCTATRFALWYDAPILSDKQHLEESQKLELEGDDLFLKKQKTQFLQAALMKWEVASSLSASSDLFIKLSRGHYLYAKETNDTENFTLGLGFAEKALAFLAPDFVEKINNGVPFVIAVSQVPKEAVPALYWYALNLSKWAEQRGFFTRMRYEKHVDAAMARVDELDDKKNSYGRLSDSVEENKR